MKLQDSARIQCPYCGEYIEVAVDPSIPQQKYVEDCEVCCRPIVFEVGIDAKGAPHITARREDE